MISCSTSRSIQQSHIVCDMGSHVRNTWYNVISHDKIKFVVAFETLKTMTISQPLLFEYKTVFLKGYLAKRE